MKITSQDIKQAEYMRNVWSARPAEPFESLLTPTIGRMLPLCSAGMTALK